MDRLTIVATYYRQPRMLAKQLETWASYGDEVLSRLKFIVVDDGSPEPAKDVIKGAPPSVLGRLDLYRIRQDIPWNYHGARNLGCHVAPDGWILRIDLDHVLPKESAERLLRFEPDEKAWYVFPRWRVGKADDTRRKDKIPEDQEFGQIHPHIDSILLTRNLYWQAGGYDEDYAGSLGGATQFLKILETKGSREVMPSDICLHVYTRHVIPDASIVTLSRDPAKYRVLRSIYGLKPPANPLRFDWAQVF